MNLLETKNNTLIDMARKQEALRLSKNKGVFKDGVNQRASIKQRMVCDTICKAVPGETVVHEPSLCKKLIDVEGLNLIDRLAVSYYSKNHLFTRIFDLIVESGVPANLELDTELAIGIRYEGAMRMSGVTFTGGSGDSPAGKLIEELNRTPLIAERILKLELTDLKIRYERHQGSWTIGVATGKGSTVWSLFPPLVMLIKFSEQDAIHLLELFQLITHAIQQFEVQQ